MLFRAISISVFLNCLMVVSGTIADLLKSLSGLAMVSSIIATPPGILLRLIMPLNGHSVGTFVAGAIAALAFSFVFYTLVAWTILWLLATRRSSQSANKK
jgi:hypothetical protein